MKPLDEIASIDQRITLNMKQLDVVVSPPAFLWVPLTYRLHMKCTMQSP